LLLSAAAPAAAYRRITAAIACTNDAGTAGRLAFRSARAAAESLENQP